jgi:hypothetical protein
MGKLGFPEPGQPSLAPFGKGLRSSGLSGAEAYPIPGPSHHQRGSLPKDADPIALGLDNNANLAVRRPTHHVSVRPDVFHRIVRSQLSGI